MVTGGRTTPAAAGVRRRWAEGQPLEAVMTMVLVGRLVVM
jgi:hypothetical protein